MLQKLKKISVDRKERLNKLKSSLKDDLKKFKKLIPESRFRNIENEVKAMGEKYASEIDKIAKEK